MEKLTDKPIGSVIEEEVDSEGITLRWWPPAAGFIHYGMAAGYAWFFCIWVAACYGGAASILVEPVGFFTCGMIVVLCVFTYAGACLAYMLWILLAPDRPASVRLEAEWLRYDPGRSKVSAWQQLVEKRSPPSMPRPLAARRSEIRGFVLEQDGERQRLYLDRGTDRLEIGAELRKPEREWLFAVLQKWHTPNEALRLTPAAL